MVLYVASLHGVDNLHYRPSGLPAGGLAWHFMTIALQDRSLRDVSQLWRYKSVTWTSLLLEALCSKDGESACKKKNVINSSQSDISLSSLRLHTPKSDLPWELNKGQILKIKRNLLDFLLPWIGCQYAVASAWSSKVTWRDTIWQ